MNEAERRKVRASIASDVGRWQSGVQTLTRATQPSAKLLDYLQEDLDGMQKELDRWRSETEQLVQKMRREQKYTPSSFLQILVFLLNSFECTLHALLHKFIP